MGRGTFGVSGPLKSTVKHSIWGVAKKVSCVNNRWTDLNNIYIV